MKWPADHGFFHQLMTKNVNSLAEKDIILEETENRNEMALQMIGNFTHRHVLEIGVLRVENKFFQQSY